MKRLLVICLAVVLTLGLAITTFSAQPTMSVSETAIEATVDFRPDTLWTSKGKLISCYIELPGGYDVRDIDISSVTLKLADTVPALAKKTKVGDYDSDGVTDLQVSFERTAVQGILPRGGEVQVTVSGEVNGEVFEGRDMIGATPAGVKVKSTILNRYGEGFLEERESGLRILHLKGTAYERGYQRVMLQGDIEFITSSNITGYYGWFGAGDPELALEVLHEAAEWMEHYIPYQYQQEIQGMADALADLGSPITYDDIVLHLVGSDISMMDLTSDLTRNPVRNPPPPMPHCSGFSAWGEATKDGSLIIGVNSDYSDTLEELTNRPLVVVEPTDGGYAYVGICWDVFPTAQGMNEAGIALNGITGRTTESTYRGVTAELLLGLILQYADSIEDAVDIVSMYPRACGLKPILADGKTNRAAVLEWSSDNAAVRFAEPGVDAIWTGNFACYPGYKGYTGFNMATVDYKMVGRDISTLEKWQASLAAAGMGSAGAWGRYEQLINENYGQIDVEKAKEILSDRYCMKLGRFFGPFEVGGRCICSYSGYNVDFENIDYYKSSRSGEYGVWRGCVGSFVAIPATGDMWWAVPNGMTPGHEGMTPVQYASGYEYLNLYDLLR